MPRLDNEELKRDGRTFTGVELLSQRWSSPFSDSPTNGAYLIDADGQQFDADITSPVGPSFGGSSKIASGDSRTGFITFELPKNAKPATLQFTLDSGFGPETDEWEL